MTMNLKQGSIPDGFFADIPKVDIHCHVYGTIREATLQEFVRETSAPLTEEEVAGYYVRGEKPRGVLHAFRFMEEYIFGSEDRLYRLTRECLEDLSAENVRYAELFWNTTGTLLHAPHLSFKAGQDAVVQAMEDAERDFGIVSRLIHSIDREASPEAAVEMMKQALALPHPRSIGLGMDYLENELFRPEGFWKAYQMAQEAGWKLTAHAGENSCHWRNIETALDLLKVDRIDHGYTVLDNPELLQRCIDDGIVFTVVPTNTHYLNVLSPAEWADKHPIRRMGRTGLKIHPNTDDPTFHNTTPNNVWRTMHVAFDFGVDDLRSFMLNGLEGVWVDDDTRGTMIAEFSSAFDEAVQKHGLRSI